MSIVAPTTALSASAVPVLAGLAMGERPGVGAFAGIAVSFIAIVLITREPASRAGLIAIPSPDAAMPARGPASHQ